MRPKDAPAKLVIPAKRVMSKVILVEPILVPRDSAYLTIPPMPGTDAQIAEQATLASIATSLLINARFLAMRYPQVCSDLLPSTAGQELVRPRVILIYALALPA